MYRTSAWRRVQDVIPDFQLPGASSNSIKIPWACGLTKSVRSVSLRSQDKQNKHLLRIRFSAKRGSTCLLSSIPLQTVHATQKSEQWSLAGKSVKMTGWTFASYTLEMASVVNSLQACISCSWVLIKASIEVPCCRKLLSRILKIATLISLQKNFHFGQDICIQGCQ